MLKKTIKYTDFNGEDQTEEVYFNLSKSELIAKEMMTDGGYTKRLEMVGKSNNGALIMTIFRELIEDSYGIKSDDGKRFTKSPEIARDFMQSAAYDTFFMELVTDADAAINFATGIMPPDLVEAARKDIEALKVSGNSETTEASDVSVSTLARERSEAQLQGHKAPATAPAPTAPAPTAEAPSLSREEVEARLNQQNSQ